MTAREKRQHGRFRGDKTSKAQRAERQAKALELMKTGATQEAIAELLGISRMTFWRDLQAIEARYVEGSKEDVATFKKSQYEALNCMSGDRRRLD